MFKYLHHVHYAVENLEDFISFLDKNFDLKPTKVDVGDRTSPSKEAIYHVGTSEIHVTQPLTETSELAKHMKKHGPGIFHVAWGVDGIDEVFNRAAKSGADIRRNAVSVTSRGYKSFHIEPCKVSSGIEFQFVEKI
jgi:4-hydroxyphenylpyruvate dioxygenase-like putative hemolysin